MCVVFCLPNSTHKSVKCPVEPQAKITSGATDYINQVNGISFAQGHGTSTAKCFRK